MKEGNVVIVAKLHSIRHAIFRAIGRHDFGLTADILC